MTWIDDRLKQRKKRQDREETIATFGETVFDDLWKQISALVTEAKGKGILIETNGGPRNRVVILANLGGRPGELGPPGDPKSLKLTLNDRDRSTIAITGTKVSAFQIDVNEDNVAYLKHDGKEISTQEAAQKILDPFLFPDLQKD